MTTVAEDIAARGDYQSQGPIKTRPCWCGSGKKYFQCHMNPTEQQFWEMLHLHECHRVTAGEFYYGHTSDGSQTASCLYRCNGQIIRRVTAIADTAELAELDLLHFLHKDGFRLSRPHLATDTVTPLEGCMPVCDATEIKLAEHNTYTHGQSNEETDNPQKEESQV